jgi:hypothetical protein
MSDPGDRTLAEARAKLRVIAQDARLLDEAVTVAARTLTPEEAIGTPERRDYPILVGKERVLEARFRDARGHAFTDAPGDWSGTLTEILDADWKGNHERARFTATLNAVLAHLDRAGGSVHCRDDEPELCAREIADHIGKEHGSCRVGLVGLNPAIAERLIRAFGAERVHVTDLNPDTIGGDRHGVTVWDGRERTDDLVAASDLVLITGTTLINGTFDGIVDTVRRHGRDYLVYGVTVAGVAALCGLPRICPLGRDG